MRTYYCAVLVCVVVVSEGAVNWKSLAAQETVSAQQSHTHTIKLVEPADPTKPLEERLQARATFHAKDAPLQDFAEELGKALDHPVILATKQFEEAGISLQTPMTYNLRNVRMRTGMGLILSEVGLNYVIKDDVLVITTPSGCGCEQLVTRVYNCHDLLKMPSPIKKMDYGPRPLVVGAGTLIPVGKPMKDAGPDGGYNIDDLTELLSIAVDPDSWDDVGGPGSISEFKGLVVIYQTPTVHEKVEGLLNMLHKAGGIEEKVKVSR